MANHAKKNKAFFSWESIRELLVLITIVFLVRTFGFGLYQVPTGSMETTMLVGERFFADKFTYLFTSPQRGDIIAFNAPPSVFEYSKNPFVRLWQDYVWGPPNWTKRVIGVPGDTVRGVVEDGKPVVYLNGKKLDEPYLNKFPLIGVWKENPIVLRQRAEQEILHLMMSKRLNPQYMSSYVEQLLRGQWDWRSYDPDYSYKNQPYYRMNADRVVKNEQGQPELLYPGTPLPPRENMQKQVQGNSYWNGTDDFYVELGDGQYWCMGDNRLGSKDCRYFGPIDKRLIHGRILFRIWSIDSTESWWIFDLIKHPVDFWSRMRWSRFLQKVS